MNVNKKLICICLLCSQTAWADEASHWYLKPTVGLSQMGDQTGQTVGIGTVDGPAEVNLSSGFTPGLAVGYQYGNGWSAELAWEYRTNDSETTLADGTFYPSGNYASNVFALNG